MIERYDPDALRWWFLRDVPLEGDADFREELIAARANELADGLGNLINRAIGLVRRNRSESARAPGKTPAEAASLQALSGSLPAAIDEALALFDLRAAAAALWEAASEANRFVSATQPWELVKAARTERRRSRKAGRCARRAADAGWIIASELRPFLPLEAERIDAALTELDVQQGRALFPKAEAVA